MTDKFNHEEENNIIATVDKSSEQAATASDGFGKFGTKEELLKAYNALEAEFTKRCQKLKEVESALSSKAQEQITSDSLSEYMRDEEWLEKHIVNNETVKALVVANYLRSFGGGAATLHSRCGAAARTAAVKPKTLEEAKKLADILIKG